VFGSINTFFFSTLVAATLYNSVRQPERRLPARWHDKAEAHIHKCRAAVRGMATRGDLGRLQACYAQFQGTADIPTHWFDEVGGAALRERNETILAWLLNLSLSLPHQYFRRHLDQAAAIYNPHNRYTVPYPGSYWVRNMVLWNDRRSRTRRGWCAWFWNWMERTFQQQFVTILRSEFRTCILLPWRE
jgi:hypothetical protein